MISWNNEAGKESVANLNRCKNPVLSNSLLGQKNQGLSRIQMNDNSLAGKKNIYLKNAMRSIHIQCI